MTKKPDRLSFRIPWLIDAVAEGPWAIGAATALGVLVIVCFKALAWRTTGPASM